MDIKRLESERRFKSSCPRILLAYSRFHDSAGPFMPGLQSSSTCSVSVDSEFSIVDGLTIYCSYNILATPRS